MSLKKSAIQHLFVQKPAQRLRTGEMCCYDFSSPQAWRQVHHTITVVIRIALIIITVNKTITAIPNHQWKRFLMIMMAIIIARAVILTIFLNNPLKLRSLCLSKCNLNSFPQ